MPVRFGLSPRLAGMTIEQCQRHWRGAHADIFREVPGLVSYVQNHAIIVGGQTLLPHPGFDVCSEVEFATAEALQLAVDSAYYRSCVLPDEASFLDAGGRRFLMTRRIVLSDDGDTFGAVKLLTFTSSCGPPPNPIADTPHKALRHLRYEVLTKPAPRSTGPGYALIDQHWFHTSEEALAYCDLCPLPAARPRSLRVLVRELVVVPGPVGQ